ncbi:MAG: hypothetical protein ABL932_22775 [Terricaulis sp.]
MGGWRDEDGRTATDRKKVKGEEDRARFAADVRHRPLTLIKGLAGLVLVMILVFALLGFLR